MDTINEGMEWKSKGSNDDAGTPGGEHPGDIRGTGHYRRHEFRLRLNEYAKAARPPRPANIAVDGSGTGETTVKTSLIP